MVSPTMAADEDGVALVAARRRIERTFPRGSRQTWAPCLLWRLEEDGPVSQNLLDTSRLEEDGPVSQNLLDTSRVRA